MICTAQDEVSTRREHASGDSHLGVEMVPARQPLQFVFIDIILEADATERMLRIDAIYARSEKHSTGETKLA